MSQVVGNELQVGDLVRVIDVDSELLGLEGYIAKTDFGAPRYVYLFESDDKQHRSWFAVESLRKLRDSWVPEPPTDHIADANKMVSPAIPAGCRELRIGEEAYREPTPADLDNGSIVVEACTPHPVSKKRVWRERVLVGITEGIGNSFVVQHPQNKGIVVCYKEARIKVEQPAIDEPTPESQGHPDHAEGVWVEEGINATSINFKPKRPVVYIAGPMRGIPHFNFPAFDAAKAYLIERGYDVLSPADFDREFDGFDPYKCEYETAEGCGDFPQEMDFERVVTRDLEAVKQCDAIALLPGWEKSKGAVAEIAVANWMGKPLMHLLCDAHRPNEVVYIVNNDSTTLEQFVLQLAHAHDAHNKAINCAIDPPPLEQDPACDILDVAASITRGDRQAVYGPPDQEFKKTADMWTGMFQYMLAPGAKFEPRHVAMAMICIKLSREFHQRKRDNWIDIAGYARCGSLCSS